MDLTEIIKKIGAFLIILVLIVMMAITFSSQPISEITSIIAGGSRIGGYAGKDISLQNYYIQHENCKNRYRAYGNVPEQIINRCVADQLQQVYTLYSLGERLGLVASEKALEKELFENVKAMYEQQKPLDKEDQIPMNELYRREISSASLQTRQQLTTAQLTFTTLADMPTQEAFVTATDKSKRVVLNFNVIRFSNADLLKKLDSTVKITEKEIRAEYEREQKLLSKEKKSPYNKQKEIVENRLKTARKQALLAKVKEKLSGLKEGTMTLADVTRITGIPARTTGDVKLTELSSARLGADPINLAIPGILSNLKRGVTGPHQADEFTVYAQLTSIRVLQSKGKNEHEADRTKALVSYGMVQEIMNREAKRNHFFLNDISGTTDSKQ